jgi:hypothetical protein
MTVRNLILKGGRGTRRYIKYDIRETPNDEWVVQYATILIDERSVYQTLSDANAAWTTAKHEAEVREMYANIAADCAIYGCD